MIAELFYPKELKDIIADLRASGNLDESKLKTLNNYVVALFAKGARGAVIISLFAAFVTFQFHYYVVTFIALVTIFLCGSILEIRNFLKKYPILYMQGCVVSGVVNGAGTTTLAGFWGQWSIYYSYDLNAKTYNSNEKPLFCEDTSKYIKGQSLDVYYSPMDPRNSVPYLHSLHELFNLKKDT